MNIQKCHFLSWCTQHKCIARVIDNSRAGPVVSTWKTALTTNFICKRQQGWILIQSRWSGESEHREVAASIMSKSWSRAGVKNDWARHQLSGTESPITGWEVPLSFIYCRPAWKGQAPAPTSFLLLMLLLGIVKDFSELYGGSRSVKTSVLVHQQVWAWSPINALFCLFFFLNWSVSRTGQNSPVSCQ